jgi:hypothetical protein
MIAFYEQLFLGVVGWFFLATLLLPLLAVMWSMLMSFIRSFD